MWPRSERHCIAARPDRISPLPRPRAPPPLPASSPVRRLNLWRPAPRVLLAGPIRHPARRCCAAHYRRAGRYSRRRRRIYRWRRRGPGCIAARPGLIAIWQRSFAQLAPVAYPMARDLDWLRRATAVAAHLLAADPARKCCAARRQKADRYSPPHGTTCRWRRRDRHCMASADAKPPRSPAVRSPALPGVRFPGHGPAAAFAPVATDLVQSASQPLRLRPASPVRRPQPAAGSVGSSPRLRAQCWAEGVVRR